VGRFRLVEPIGEGGFGRVWVAEQREPVQRRVALKIIRTGMDSGEVLMRFEMERQMLAVLDHPSIAKVLDAGVTDGGRPYFAMEHVPGSSITSFCDAGGLRLRERLELFIPACEAVHHAHQKGIIHRDLKPTNILVTLIDGRPLPKVIDFGISKATSAAISQRAMQTEDGRVMGTPEYMSPEQAGGVGTDIDTRSDVYSLGVVLYELLTGTLPFDGQMLRNAGYLGLARIIRETEPPKPSTRLTTLVARQAEQGSGPTPAQIAERYGADTLTLKRELRGDLDWIVMRCLEKDRARRYGSASELALDIRRYLDGKPVEAAPPSQFYRVRKFVRRHRGTVIAAAAAAVSLVAGVVGFAWQSYRVGLQRDLALSAKDAEAAQRRIADQQRDRAVAAEAESQTRADNLQKVADFQSEMLGQVDPTTAGVRLTEDVTGKFEAALAKAGVPEGKRAAQVEQFASLWSRVNATDAARELIDGTILQPAVVAIEKRFENQPAVAATLRGALALRYKDLGMTDTALALEQQALDARRRVLGEDHPDTIASIGNVGAFLAKQGKLSEGEPYYHDVLERSRRVNGEEHPRTLTCIANLGFLLKSQGKLNDAEPFYRNALEKRRRVLGDDHPDTLTSIHHLGILRQEQGRFSEAESLYREALERRRRVLGNEHRDTLATLNSLAVLLNDQEKADQAIAHFREVVAGRRRVLGEAHPSTLLAMQNLGTVLGSNGRPDEGEALMREALSNQRRLLGRNHPDTINSLSNLAVFLTEKGKLAEAEPLCREALERRVAVLGNEHPETLIARNVLAYLLLRQKRAAEAEPYLREALDISRRVLGPQHPETLRYAHNLAGSLLEQGRPADAEPLLREVVEAGGPALGDENSLVLSATSRLGGVLVELKRPAEAAELLTHAEPASRKVFTGSSERSLVTFLLNLGKARTGLGQFASAESVLLEGHAIVTKTDGSAQTNPRACMQALAELYAAWDAVEPWAGNDARAAEWSARLKALEVPATQPGPPGGN
jgi:serine/threonine protein kinase/tetratricopeptide (TPR) repeat protein